MTTEATQLTGAVEETPIDSTSLVAEPTAEEVNAVVEGADSPETDKPKPKGKAAEAEAAEAKAKADAAARIERARKAAEQMREDRRAREQAARDAAAARYAAEQYKQELARERAAREEAQARLQRIDQDPLSYLRDERQLSADELARRAVEDADPAVKIQRMAERIKAFEEREREREERAEQIRLQRVQQANQQRAESAFLEKARDLEAYPHLAAHAEHRPRAIVREALEVIQEAHQRTGLVYSDEEALEYLEDLYAKSASPKTSNSNGTSSQSNATLSGQATNTGTGPQVTKQAGKPRTLSGKDAVQSASLPANYDDLPPHEQKRLDAELYRKLRTK